MRRHGTALPLPLPSTGLQRPMQMSRTSYQQPPVANLDSSVFGRQGRDTGNQLFAPMLAKLDDVDADQERLEEQPRHHQLQESFQTQTAQTYGVQGACQWRQAQAHPQQRKVPFRPNEEYRVVLAESEAGSQGSNQIYVNSNQQELQIWQGRQQEPHNVAAQGEIQGDLSSADLPQGYNSPMFISALTEKTEKMEMKSLLQMNAKRDEFLQGIDARKMSREQIEATARHLALLDCESVRQHADLKFEKYQEQLVTTERSSLIKEVLTSFQEQSEQEILSNLKNALFKLYLQLIRGRSRSSQDHQTTMIKSSMGDIHSQKPASDPYYVHKRPQFQPYPTTAKPKPKVSAPQPFTRVQESFGGHSSVHEPCFSSNQPATQTRMNLMAQAPNHLSSLNEHKNDHNSGIAKQLSHSRAPQAHDHDEDKAPEAVSFRPFDKSLALQQKSKPAIQPICSKKKSEPTKTSKIVKLIKPKAIKKTKPSPTKPPPAAQSCAQEPQIGMNDACLDIDTALGAKLVKCNSFEKRVKPKRFAWACKHSDRLHYGKGMCGNCYHLAYYHRRRAALNAVKTSDRSKYKNQVPQNEDESDS